MKRWGLKDSFSELIRRRNPGRVFYQTTLAIFPPIIALLIITVSTSLLWVLGQGIFLQTEAGQNFSYQAFCLNNQGKLITSVSVKNNTSNMLRSLASRSGSG